MSGATPQELAASERVIAEAARATSEWRQQGFGLDVSLLMGALEAVCASEQRGEACMGLAFCDETADRIGQVAANTLKVITNGGTE